MTTPSVRREQAREGARLPSSATRCSHSRNRSSGRRQRKAGVPIAGGESEGKKMGRRDPRGSHQQKQMNGRGQPAGDICGAGQRYKVSAIITISTISQKAAWRRRFAIPSSRR